jgi:hypothetical protein
MLIFKHLLNPAAIGGNDKFDIIGTVNRDSKGWRINISTKSYDKFFDLVEPNVISMKYKLPPGGV